MAIFASHGYYSMGFQATSQTGAQTSARQSMLQLLIWGILETLFAGSISTLLHDGWPEDVKAEVLRQGRTRVEASSSRTQAP